MRMSHSAGVIPPVVGSSCKPAFWPGISSALGLLPAVGLGLERQQQQPDRARVRAQLEKVDRRSDGYGLEWLDAVTKGNRVAREACTND